MASAPMTSAEHRDRAEERSQSAVAVNAMLPNAFSIQPAPTLTNTPFMANPSTTSFVPQTAPLQPAGAAEDLSMLFPGTSEMPPGWEYSSSQWNDSARQNCQPSYPCQNIDGALHYAAYPGTSLGPPYLSNYQVGSSSTASMDSSRPRSDPQLDQLLSSMERMYHSPCPYQLVSSSLQTIEEMPDQPHLVPIRSIEVDYHDGQTALNNNEMDSASNYVPSRQLTRATTEAPLLALGESRGTPPRDESVNSQEYGEVEDKDKPYAQFIWSCLSEAPDNALPLKDIYDWFEAHTEKAKDKQTTGWKNSIRHNLSMNGAFHKVPAPIEGSNRRRYIWKLTDDALRNGVKSTTRYRNKPQRRGYRLRYPQPQRQASGSRGGLAARKALRVRRTETQREARSIAARFRGTSTPRRRDVPRSTPSVSGTPATDAIMSPTSDAAYNDQPMPSYYPQSAPSFTPAAPQHPRSTMLTPQSGYQDSFPNTPGLYDTQELMHMLDLSEDRPLFYDSPDSSHNGPLTPPSTDGMLMDIFDPDVLM